MLGYSRREKAREMVMTKTVTWERKWQGGKWQQARLMLQGTAKER
jgi:hypothetical protein